MGGYTIGMTTPQNPCPYCGCPDWDTITTRVVPPPPRHWRANALLLRDVRHSPDRQSSEGEPDWGQSALPVLSAPPRGRLRLTWTFECRGADTRSRHVFSTPAPETRPFVTPACHIDGVPLDLDLTFLTVPIRLRAVAPPPVNVYEVLRDGWRETRVDMTLLFLLNPSERHGLGSLVIDALLATLHGAPFIREEGTTTTVLSAPDYVGSTAWEIQTQADRIDVLATNTDSGLAIVLENKIGHILNNPLGSYAASALKDPAVNDVLVVVLAPEQRNAQEEQSKWLSRSITYAQLAEEIRRSPRLVEQVLDPVDQDQRRSLDLLEQFMEMRTREGAMRNDSDDAARLQEWRVLLEDHQEAIEAFNRARKDMRAVIKRRRESLEAPIADRIAESGFTTDTTTPGGGSDDFQELGYYFTDADWTIGLCFQTRPGPLSELYVYDNSGRGNANRRRQPLGVAWTESDDTLADAFLARVAEIRAEEAPPTRS